MLENNSPRMGIRDGLPVGIGYFVISFAIGVFASSLGLSSLETLAFSMLNFTSAGEIAALPMIAAGGSLIEIALTQLLINSRYALMGMSLSQKLGKSVRVRDRFLIALFLGDEIFALSYSKSRAVGCKYMYGLILLPYLGWSSGALAGSLVGDALPPILADAFSIALYAMLVTILAQASKSSRGTLACVLVSIAASFAFAYLPGLKDLPDGLVIVIITLAISTLFALAMPIPENNTPEGEVEA